MVKSAKSVFIFGIYLALLGLGLILAPNPLLTLFGFAPATDVWIRVVGVLVLVLGYHSILAARTGTMTFFRRSVVARYAVFLFFIVFVVLGLAQPVLLLFGVIDFAGATWTAVALRGNAGK